MKELKSQSFFFSKEEPFETGGEGVNRQVLGYDDNIMMVKVMFEKGAIGTLHSHPHVQTSYVVSGKFEVQIGDEKKMLNAGDGFYVEPDLLHGCRCLEEGMLIDVFNPMREDFL